MQDSTELVVLDAVTRYHDDVGENEGSGEGDEEETIRMARLEAQVIAASFTVKVQEK